MPKTGTKFFRTLFFPIHRHKTPFCSKKGRGQNFYSADTSGVQRGQNRGQNPDAYSYPVLSDTSDENAHLFQKCPKSVLFVPSVLSDISGVQRGQKRGQNGDKLAYFCPLLSPFVP